MSRFPFPTAYDPQMYREEALTLLRTTSKRNAPPTPSGESPSSFPMALKVASAHQHKPNGPQRRHYVFADPVAFRYLEEDSATVVIERRGRLTGYELYLVEQWACSRVHPTFIITSYTGDPDHSIVVGVLGVPTDEETWSPRLRVYFKAISQFHARTKETPLGLLMVTNLSSFPSALTVIPVPDGDVRKHREDFIVNENLKRLGCSGRSGMNLSIPAGATQAKFKQLYKTSDRIPIYSAVMELVKLCQVALMIFGKLEQEYADGLLCDVTEKAINDWWTDIGSEFYNIEPTDGILGPTTVAALLGILVGARNRLNYYGAPVSKDAFDVYSLKRGIAYFQKSHKLERTRRLDRITLDRLHRVTAKAAAGEGWAVPKAVKSTVAELSGKGGEMVMDIVGRDKAGIGDIETLNIDQFVSLVHGERLKWLWYGKPRRSGNSVDHGSSELNTSNFSFTKDDHGGYIWSHSKSDSHPLEEDSEARKKEPVAVANLERAHTPTGTMVESPAERDPQLRKTVFKSVAGKMNDARSGFGKIKDAVGLRGHASKPSKDEDDSRNGYFNHLNSSSPATNTTAAPTSPHMIGKTFTWKETPSQYHNGAPKGTKSVPELTLSDYAQGPNTPPPPNATTDAASKTSQEDLLKDAEASARWTAQVKTIRHDLVANDPSVAGSNYSEGDLEGPLLEAERDPHNFQVLLHRRHSISTMAPTSRPHHNEAYWSRQMSFSDAEEAILTWEPIFDFPTQDQDEADSWTALQIQNRAAEDLKHLYEKVLDLQDNIGVWVGSQLHHVEGLESQAGQDQDDFQTLLYQLNDSYSAVKQSSHDILEDERANAMESMKEIEILGAKLEYEINALASKVEDVEVGVTLYERQVYDLEMRANELEEQLKIESWPHWIVRTLTGIGTGPPATVTRRE